MAEERDEGALRRHESMLKCVWFRTIERVVCMMCAVVSGLFEYVERLM